MDKYEIIALLVMVGLFAIPAVYVIRWGIAIARSPKLPPSPEFDTESWIHDGKELTIFFKKVAGPSQQQIDEIKTNIDRYHAMILEHINTTGLYKEDTKDGLVLEGVSFPIDDDEQGEYDFSVDYVFKNDAETFLNAYFKDGKIESLMAGD